MSSGSATPVSDGSPRPKWRRPAATHKMGSFRYVLKMTVLFLGCVFLGLSVATLYPSHRAPSLPGPNPTTGGAGVWSQHDLAHFEHDIPKGSHANAGTKGSIYSKFSNKVHSLQPWRKTYSHCGEQYSIHADEGFGERPRIAKITINTAGDGDDVYERALLTHAAHNRLHNYPMLTLRHNIMENDGVWSKPAYILSTILRELAKPPAERLQWLLWVDADTVILNPHIPVDIFLPPAGWSDVNLMVTRDFNGLNNGVFPIRVCSWSVELLSAVLSFPHYKPNIELEFRDQSALEHLLKQPRFERHTMSPPQRWFNGYPGELNDTLAPFQIRRGDLLVHFAGFGDREERMSDWLRRAEQHDADWELDLKSTTYPTEVKAYWSDMNVERKAKKKASEEAQEKASQLIDDVSDWMEKHPTVIHLETKEDIRKQQGRLTEFITSEDYKDRPNDFDAAVDGLKQATAPLRALVVQMSKSLYREAHDIIVEIESDGRLDLEHEDLEKEVKEFHSAFKNLKERLMEEEVNPGKVDIALKSLIDASGKMESKYNTLIGSEFKVEKTEAEALEYVKAHHRMLHGDPPPPVMAGGVATEETANKTIAQEGGTLPKGQEVAQGDANGSAQETNVDAGDEGVQASDSEGGRDGITALPPTGDAYVAQAVDRGDEGLQKEEGVPPDTGR